MLRDKIKFALIRAIKSFISEDEIFSQDWINEVAQDWVYEHDEEVRSQLRDGVDLDANFEDELSNIDYEDVF